MNKFSGIVIIIAGVGLSALWVVKDPGFASVFKNLRVIIGFIPLPGILFGGLIQLSAAITAIVIGLEKFNNS